MPPDGRRSNVLGMPATQPAWCPRLLAELRAADARATALAKPLTAVQLNWRPSPVEWSIGQCLDHLLVVNRVYLPPIADALQRAPRAVVDEITPGWFGRWFIRTYIAPSPAGRKAKAPAKITPVSEVDASILDRFLVSNEETRRLIERASEYDVNRTRFKNPFGPIRFTIGTGLEIISKHQDRHLGQAERIRAAMAVS
jgi:hypothetical protein